MGGASRSAKAAVLTAALLATARWGGASGAAEDVTLAQDIARDTGLISVQARARSLLRSGQNAGSVYKEIWIRDLNTFIELALTVQDRAKIRESLVPFFELQTADGEIVDAYESGQSAAADPEAVRITARPELTGHKNTVESDQESSLVQAVARYVEISGDRSILAARINGLPVAERLELALRYVVAHRYSNEHRLVWGGTRVDWGDVQPEDSPGVDLDAASHRAFCIYDNAMFLIAIDKLLGLDVLLPNHAITWRDLRQKTAEGIRTHLWDAQRHKFVPHVYLGSSPFPRDFDENAIWYHGGTAVAITAGLLDRDEIGRFNAQLLRNQRACGAASIGLTVYPPYPAGLFKNPLMRPYSYQNGGDWSWFGARMVEQLVEHGFVREAYDEFRPIIAQVQENKGFYEWYDLYNHRQGAGDYRGSAGVIFQAAAALQRWSHSRLPPPSDYRLGATINFGRNGNSVPFTRWGWSHEEEAFTWTEGCSAALAMRIDPTEVPLQLEMIIGAFRMPPEINSQAVSVYINDQKAADWTVTDTAAFIAAVPPELSRAGGVLTIELRIPTAASPESLNLSSDPRYLGVYCKTAVLSPKILRREQPGAAASPAY